MTSDETKKTTFDPMHATRMNQGFKKGKPPALGTAFGDWSGDSNVVLLPGGSALTFNLDQLTLADFRQMRYHPQVNISLSILNFMLHQIEWQITPSDASDPKALSIASAAEENLRVMWAQMVGALNQSFWAGYAPTAIEWDNNPNTGQIDITRFKDLQPERCLVNWKEVRGWAPPGHTPPKFKTYDGIVQVGGQSWPIPSENSLWYPLLMENGDYYGRKLLKPAFTPWYFSMLVHLFANRYYERFGEPTPIGRAPYDAEVETPDGVMTGREAMETVMSNLRSRGVVTLPSDRDPVTKEFEYTLEYMESQMRGVDFDRYMSRLDEEISLGMFTPLLLFRSGDVGSNSLGVQHTQCVAADTPILCGDRTWKAAKDLVVGDEIIAFDDKEKSGRPRRWRMAVIEGNRPAHKECFEVVTDIGPKIVASFDHPWLVRRYGRYEWMDTADLLPGDQILYVRKRDVHEIEIGEQVYVVAGDTPGCSTSVAVVESVESVGQQLIASIKTSAGTFITDGYLSHNTFLWMLNGIYGDMKYYIDRYVLKRWKTINYGPNAPDIQWSFHKMGRESQETIRAIISALLGSNKATVDLDELGQALGMTVKEVRAATDNPAGDTEDATGGETTPGSDVRQRDDKKGSGNVATNGEPRATGHQISNRVGHQVRAAWKKAAFDREFSPSFGFERRMVESLMSAGVQGDDAEARVRAFYAKLERAVADLAALGMGSFSGPADVMAMIDRHIDFGIDEMLS
jgi:hypothetical protein